MAMFSPPEASLMPDLERNIMKGKYHISQKFCVKYLNMKSTFSFVVKSLVEGNQAIL